MKTSQLEVAARPLITIRADSLMWMDPVNCNPVPIAGALVRIYPPPWATDVLIASVKSRLSQLGAVSVRTMPKPSAGQIVNPVTAQRKQMNARQKVQAMVEESNSTNKDKLAEVTSSALSEVGL